ncbi:helix-turn-helix transcriptional regulator [Streptomyces chartreusis]|uniref:helix-turn-helix domain-containing protein n=1 Tax=Streptomyces chartreusis TaxID=1969 RepID=UPI0034043E44
MRFNRPVKDDLPEERRRLAEALRAEAVESGLTADQIARRAHASKGAISQAMSGTRVPSESLFRSIVRAISRDPLSPQWVALYVAAITTAATLLIAALLSGADHIDSAPEPPAYPYRPPVQIDPEAKRYKQPTGEMSFASAFDPTRSATEVNPGYVCAAGNRRYGVSPFGIQVYIAEEDLVIPASADIDACDPYAKIKPGAEFYKQPTGDKRWNPALDWVFAGVDVELDDVCISGATSSAAGARRYGLGDRSSDSLTFVAERDLVIPPAASIRACPVSVELKAGAKLYRQPTDDTPIHRVETSGQSVNAGQVCISDTGSHTSTPRRYGISDMGGLVDYVAAEDLVILPEAGNSEVCPEFAQIKSGAKLYTQPAGNTEAGWLNSQSYPGGDVDPDETCVSDTESGTSGERWFGLHDALSASGDGLVYVSARDVEMPRNTSLRACAAG